MRCPNCGVTIPKHSNFCSYCGVNLRAMHTRGALKWVLGLGALLVCLGIFYYLIVDFSKPSMAPLVGTESGNQSSIPDQQPDLIQPQTTQRDLPTGMVTIRDISGAILWQIRAPVVSGGWLALPLNICYGGYHWSFSPEPGKDIKIEWGILHDHDEVGLWWLEKDPGVNAPELVPWASRLPLQWAPLASLQDPVPVKVDAYAEQGKFVRVVLPPVIEKAGVFLQDNRVVGWSFGRGTETGYLWQGRQGSELVYNDRVQDFYRRTFGGSREEHFALALARNDYTDLGLLAALAEGFGLESRIPAQCVPARLRPEPIIITMRLILKTLVSEESLLAVSDVFDSRVLIQARDPLLLADVISAVRKGRGFDHALGLMENVLVSLPSNQGPEASRLAQIHLQLYQGRLKELMADGDFADAVRVLEAADVFFPEDPVLHLLRVQLALEKNDWEEAESLLLSKQYPTSLQGMVADLSSRIAKSRSMEGKIVIRFVPGSRYIPIRARLNGTIRQEFIIDTGATLSTIPSATARGLGLRIDHTNPVRSFYTAAGVKEAPEVLISSVKIGDWVIHDIRALVVDLPRQPDLGLLGLNYLNHFSMNLAAEEGMLTLAPR